MSRLPPAGVALLAGSGCAALIYQVVWVRLLRLSMGSTSASMSTVLAAFFGGLALGSWLAGRASRRGPAALRLFLALECTIALCGLALLPLLLRLHEFVSLLPGGADSLAGRFSVTMLLLGLPCMCMGATLPVLAGVLVLRQRDMASRLGGMYGLNTAGAVVGAALTGFVLVPRLGLDGANAVAVGLNLSVVMLGLAARKSLTASPVNDEVTVAPGASVASAPDAPVSTGAARALSAAAAAPNPTPKNTPQPTRARRAQRSSLPFLFVTGLTAIATEVGWTRILAIFTGSTLYGLAAILAIFLGGIALGAWAIRSRLDGIRSHPSWLAYGATLLALALLGTRACLSTVPAVHEALAALKLAPWLHGLLRYGYTAALLIAPTFLFGALFPLALSVYCGRVAALPRRMGSALAVNTFASILGSIGAGFWWIPRYGTDAMLLGCAVLIGTLPLLLLPSLAGRARVAALALTAIVALAAARLPGLDLQRLVTSVRYAYDEDAQQGEPPEYLFIEEGDTGVISVVTYNGQVAKLQNNGLNEAWIDLKNPRHGVLAETLLGLLPTFLHDAPRSALVIGLGGGTTVRALTFTPLESIRVLELEPVVVRAVTAVLPLERLGLDDPRVELDIGDARHALLVQPDAYDLIVSQPSHPWLAGAANLFTREFFQLVTKRLTPGGIFGQWVNLFHMDATTLRSVLAAFFEVFPHGFALVVESSSDLLLFGSEQPIRFDHARITERMWPRDIRARLKVHMIRGPDDLLGLLALSRAEALAASADAVPNSDLNILTEVRLGDLGPELTPEQDPFGLLAEFGQMDLSELLAEGELTQRLHAVGLALIKRGRPERVPAVIEQLQPLAPDLAADLATHL
ncbi:MAG: hypothetical protein DRQ55_18190 [Planctomycetota bacterium]|nr:MAG: hypothetical protein DRQ55_18190 [Planctomycetota bacterium]